MGKVYIKAWFGDWKEVDKEKARGFISGLSKGMTCIDEIKIRIINEKHLKGITYEELFRGEE